MNSIEYINTLNITTPLVEADIQPLLKLFNFNVSDNFNLVNVKIKLQDTINNINIENSQYNNPKDVVISIFNIYDDNDILNPDYGSTHNEFLKTAYTFNDLFEKKNIKIPLYYNSTSYSVIDNMAILNYFLNTPTKYDTLILSFGSLNHATCLVFKKINGTNITQVTHINTGLGLDVFSISNISYDKKLFYNLFEKTIYLTPEMHNAFILFLKPFFFFRKLQKEAVDNIPYAYAVYVLSDYCERILNMNITVEDKVKMVYFYYRPFKNIEEYYIYIYEQLKNNKEYIYIYLNDIFTLKKYLSRIENSYSINYREFHRILNKEVFEKYNKRINENSKIFYEDFKIKKTETYNQYIGTDEYRANYLNKALNNIDLYFDTELLITTQAAGTCMFKSLLVSIFYYLIDSHPQLITDFYIEFSEKCYDNLELYFGIRNNILYQFYYECINTSKICWQLIKDNIISTHTSLNNIVVNNFLTLTNNIDIFYDISTITSGVYIRPWIVSIIPLYTLNELLYNIRNKTLSETEIEHNISVLIDDYLKNSLYNDISRTYGELMLIGFIWELYFNYDKWEAKMNQYIYHYTNLIYLEILNKTKSRINCSTNEINWISKCLYYFMFNYKELEECKILKIVLDLEKLYMKDIKNLDDGSHQTILPLFKDIDKYNLNTSADNYEIYNTKQTPTPMIYKLLKISKINTNTLHYIVLYLDYLFSKNDNQFDTALSQSYLLDHDISNINRFLIHYLKNNTDFYIELEHTIKYIYDTNMFLYEYYNSETYNEELFFIKNLYIFNSLIEIYKLYYIYLDYDEQYNFLKQTFINLKSILKYPVSYIIYKLVANLLNSLNTILDEVFLEVYIPNNPEDMTFDEISSYSNMTNHTANLYSIQRPSKQRYIIRDYNIYIFLYEHILNLFENNERINIKNIDVIIHLYKYKIDSPYFKPNLEDKTKMDLIINNNTITSNFIEITNIRTYHIFENMFLLSDILLNYNKNKCYINSEQTYLVYVLKKSNYSNTNSIMAHDIIIAFNIKSTNSMTFNILNNMYINSNNAILCSDDEINTYPFMAHASSCTINIIEENNNNFIVHCIANSLNINDVKPYDYPFHKITTTKYDCYYTSFNIKPNYLTPYTSNEKRNYLLSFYYILPPYKLYIKNSNISNNLNDYIKNIKLNNLPIKHLEKIKKLLYKTGANLVDIINSILSEKSNSKYTDLVQWINNNTHENTLKRYNGNFDCKLECSFIIKPEFREKIEKNLTLIKSILNHLTSILNHNYSNYFEFLYNNYESCSYIMIINIYISKLNRFLKVIDNCDTILCHELLEMNQIFEKRFDNNISIVSGIIEIIFGNLLKNEQWEKIFSMYDNFLNRGTPGNKWEVHQFMMGKGKSSIITPMLIVMIAYNLQYQNIYPRIYLVVPEHLKQQTTDIISEYEMFFNISIHVVNDTDIKLKFLESVAVNESFETSIVFIDEFDYMYNPTQSNFNKIEYAKQIDLNIIDNIFNIAHKIIHHNIKFTNPRPFKGISEITTILNDPNNIKHVSYGMSIIYDYRYCIPYLRKDSPNEGSKFSSILLTIVLTILYFYNKEHKIYMLEEKDIKLAFSDKKIFNKLRWVYRIEEEDLETFLYRFKLINSERKVGIPENIMILYLKLIFLNFKKSEIVMNCSFIDIINAESIWQVGYSGTVNIDMNIEPLNDITKYNIQIIKDNDEYEHVKSALTYYTDVLQINNVDEMFNTFVNEKYNVLIDECAFLKDYDNKQVAEILFIKILDKYQVKKTIIYLLSNDTKMIYNGSHHIYEEKMYNTNEVVYYYSQRHIVGIDFKQPTLLTGLVLLNSNSIYTNVSQAIFRMRKLNKGHSIRIGYIKTADGQSITSPSVIYELLNINEQAINKKNKLLLLYQYLKFYVRKYHTRHYYEIDLDMFKDTPTIETIRNKIAHNVFSIKSENEKPWIYDYVNEIYMDFDKIPEDAKITELLKMLLIGNNLDDLLKLVFNTNSSQKETSSEVQTITQSDVVVQKQSVISIVSLLPKNYTRVVVKYNPFYKYLDGPINTFRRFNYIEIIFDNGYILLFSYNLFHNITKYDSAIIVEISDNIYLLDHISMINHYVYMCRIYNLNGRCINNFIFKDKPFINFSDMFNYTLVYDKTNQEINIGYILFNIDNEEKPSTKQYENFDNISRLILLICASNINIFQRDDLYIQDIKRYFDSKMINMMIPNEDLIDRISKYIEEFYKTVSNNYNLLSNNLIEIKTRPETNIQTQHTLTFVIDNTNETLFKTIAV